MNLLAITSFIIPVVVAEQSLRTIQAAARQGDEAFVAWTGRVDGHAFRFSRAIVPRQTAHKTPHGLLVTVDGDALFEVNRDCYQHGELLAGQIHAHPGAAYHSGADDELAIVAIPGGLSIVIPDFARKGLTDVKRWACFQLPADGSWSRPRPDLSIEIQ
jgi:hypothetical protein